MPTVSSKRGKYFPASPLEIQGFREQLPVFSLENGSCELQASLVVCETMLRRDVANTFICDSNPGKRSRVKRTVNWSPL